MTEPTIPRLGLGTFGRTGPEGLDALLAALEIGYRHLDTAQSYGTEANVGEAVRRSGLPRDAVFITTKVADTNLAAADFMRSVETSLATLGVDHVDLLLVHWPVRDEVVPLEAYITALAEAQARGYARRIGVSNFTVALLERTAAILKPGAISTNQVEIHPFLQNPVLVRYARSVGLPLTGYRPLAEGRVNSDPTLGAIAERHATTPAAVGLAFLLAQGHIAIPASGNRDRLAANFAAQDLALGADEIAAIERLDAGHRFINPAKSPAWDD